MRSHVSCLLVLALLGPTQFASGQSPAPGGIPKAPNTLPPRFAASEGQDGTGNPLAYNENLAFGSVTVGQGPNDGTLVRVTNAGQGPMRLGVPLLSGTNPDDFWVEIESQTVELQAGPLQPGAGFPFRVRKNAAGPGVALRLVAAEVQRLGGLREVVLPDVPLPGLGPVTLALRRRELPIAADSKLVVDGREVAGGVRALAGGLQVWSGFVIGHAGSRVFVLMDEGTAGGFVELPGGLESRIQVLSDGPGRVRLVPETELAALGIGRLQADLCSGEVFRPGYAPVTVPPTPSGPRLRVASLSECRLAIETDWQLYQKFNSSVLLTNYITGLVAATSEQYITDVQTTLAIAYLGIHTNSNDGWTSQETGGDTYALLEEFRAGWGTTWPAQADLAHFVSGADLGGGIAYVDVLCHQEYGFGVSANIGGDISWPSWTGAPGDFWDFVVFAHELGHNFGTLHTHDYCPPLDQCYSNCNGATVCSRGTIMGYCHLCAGGLTNVDLHFHPVTADVMRHSIEASCLGDAQLAGGDYVQYRVRFNPLFTSGGKIARLEFTHDAPNTTTPFRVRLSGNGI